MNQIKLSLRAAQNPRVIKEESGVPTFAVVFAIHNPASGDEPLPITVKANKALARQLCVELQRGVAFVVEGFLSYYKNPNTNKEVYSIWAEKFTDIVPPQSKTQPSHE